MNPLPLKLMIVLTLVGCLSSYPQVSWSADGQDLDSLIKSENAELKALKQKIANHENKLSSMGKKENRILRTLENIQDRSRLRERELEIYHWNIGVNKKKLARLKKNIHAYETQLSRQKSVIAKRLRSIYKEGDLFLVKLLFSADNFSDLVQNVKYVENIMAHDADIFEEYRRQLAALMTEKESLEKSRSNLFDLEKSALKKKSELMKERQQKSQFLKNIQTRQVYLIQVRKELIRAQGNLNELIAKLKEKQDLGKDIHLEDVQGRLSYPVQGKILSGFGRKKDKKYGTYILHNGINLKVHKGTPVKAIFYGKVLYTGFLEGYGNLVILGHGNNYHSLYGHLNRIRVSKDDFVQEGQVIGESGDSGSILGENLYFELRHLGKPIEPTPWFKVAKK